MTTLVTILDYAEMIIEDDKGRKATAGEIMKWLRALSKEEEQCIECEHLDRHAYNFDDQCNGFYCAVCGAHITEDQGLRVLCDQGEHTWQRTTYNDGRPDDVICLVCSLREHETGSNV